MTMCQMGGTTVPVHTLMGLIVEAFPIAVFCKQVDRRHRCITEIVEAYAAYDGQARTKPLFQYVDDGGKYRWERVGAISSTTAELLLSNRVDEAVVKQLMAEPVPPKGVKK